MASYNPREYSLAGEVGDSGVASNRQNKFQQGCALAQAILMGYGFNLTSTTPRNATWWPAPNTRHNCDKTAGGKGRGQPIPFQKTLGDLAVDRRNRTGLIAVIPSGRLRKEGSTCCSTDAKKWCCHVSRLHLLCPTFPNMEFGWARHRSTKTSPFSTWNYRPRDLALLPVQSELAWIGGDVSGTWYRCFIRIDPPMGCEVWARHCAEVASQTTSTRRHLGLPFLGQGLLFNHQRGHHAGRGTSVPGKSHP